MLKFKSPHEMALKARFGLDWIKISQDSHDPSAPYETRVDELNGSYVERIFYCPRVDFSYKGRRHFCYVPIKTTIDKGRVLWHTYARHSEDYKQMEEALCEILTQFVEDEG